jgi:two-component system sensor histidine kinase KdpD
MVKKINILDFIKKIIEISNNESKSNFEKLQDIIIFLTQITETSKGSIMIKKDRLNMEVAASTNPDIVGIKQPLNGDSPSCWVFKNKMPLYIEKNQNFDGQRCEKSNYDKQAFLIIPVIRENDVIGVINLTEKKDSDCFSDEERGVLLDLAGIIISQIETFRLTEELKNNQYILSQKNKKLKKLEKIRNEFFQMMVHDLKGPVSEVIANLDILSYTVTDENMEYVKSAQAGCDNMYSMISNLLDITRLEEGSLNLIHEKISAQEIINEASSRLFATAKNKSIEIKDESGSKDTAYIWGDKGILLRVLQNIIMNAIIHSDTKDSIYTGFEKDKDHIVFYVKDNGKGVPAEEQEEIFEKYFHSRDKKASSTGLGLSFCKLAVEAHKGRIWVESDGKNGSSFKFMIPEIIESEEDLELDFKD